MAMKLHKNIKTKMTNEERWNFNYRLTLEFVLSGGKIRTDTVYKKVNIGRWVSNQKDKYRKGKLDELKIYKLEKIGIVWDCFEHNFTHKHLKLNFELLKEAKELGIDVPKSVRKFFEEIKGYSKVKGTRFYNRYLHVSRYIDLDTLEIKADIDYNKFERELLNLDHELVVTESATA